MVINHEKYETMPLGIVVQRTPGVTKWKKWNWKAVAVLPGANDAEWTEMRRYNAAIEYHAATPFLELHGSDTEAYRVALSDYPPCVYVVMEESDIDDENPNIILVTASPFEAQDYCDTGEELVEKVPMPHGLVAWIREFVERHHEEEIFKKRKRDRQRVDFTQDGIGDPRISRMQDVYRSPTALKKEHLN